MYVFKIDGPKCEFSLKNSSLRRWLYFQLFLQWTGIAKSCDHHDYHDPQPPTTSHNFPVTTHDHRRAGISSPYTPTTSHNFTAISHNFIFATHDHPQPTIIKSPLPTNNDSRQFSHSPPCNNKLYTIFLPPQFTQQNSKSSLNLFATTHRTPRNLLFQKV